MLFSLTCARGMYGGGSAVNIFSSFCSRTWLVFFGMTAPSFELPRASDDCEEFAGAALSFPEASAAFLRAIASPAPESGLARDGWTRVDGARHASNFGGDV